MDRAGLVALFEARPVFLAPMEDVSDAAFRRVCRARGARVCFTEFVHVENLLAGCASARKRLELGDDDAPTAVQIYGADPDALEAAAEVAAGSGAAFLDINCGCWVPRVVGRGAGAGWLREPDAMVAMARRVVARVAPLPVTVKTRIGYGPESHMPIVDLARRLEDAGVAAITIHCRTAKMGHSGAADWSWATRARAVVTIPVVVNGDVRTASDARRALAETGCDGVMVGRRAIEHPWVFREARALLDTGAGLPRPTRDERLALCRDHLAAARELHGDRAALALARRGRLAAYLKGLPDAPACADALARCRSLAEVVDVLGAYEAALRAGARFGEAAEAAMGAEGARGTGRDEREAEWGWGE